MRITQLNMIYILALSSILTIGFDASAQLDPNMEAGVDCSSAECMFRGNSQPRDAVAGLQKIPMYGSAKLIKVNNFANNPDFPVDRSTHPQFGPIGEVETVRTLENADAETGKGIGTAFLVSPCLIVTNHHAVFGNDLQPKAGVDYRVHFRVGADNEYAFADDVIGSPVAWGNRDYRNRHDWALVRLNKCVGATSKYGWLETSALSAKQLIGKPVAFAGYASSHDQGDLRMSKGAVESYDGFNDTLKFTGSTSPQASGGVMLTVENNMMTVVGINRGVAETSDTNKTEFGTYTSTNANTFLSIQEVLGNSQARALIDADKAGHANPALVSLKKGIQVASKNTDI